MRMPKNLLLYFILFIGLTFYFFFPREQYFIFNPRIDTKFAPTFNENKFQLIDRGMSRFEVEKLLGPPLTIDTLKYFYPNQSVYALNYSQDGACSWGDFAWLDVFVLFDKDWKVSLYGQAYRND